ncbi:hypothetical protein DSO57_1019271 [Entomophthora muscae]|uniref:Uncharacterized protein n=1 Tax=Entomophthora muscae TaxID=34485 RepID=A0ACC2RIL0_9FUNG|nr:hypothetical protein DSO57_1019271 [Entomophthora muscae]
MVDKTRKVKYVPSYLSDAWRDPEVKRIVKQIDCWVSEFHDSLVPKDVQGSIKLPKTKATNSASLESNATSFFSKQKMYNEDLALLETCLASIQIPEKKDDSAFLDPKENIKDVTPETLQVTSLVDSNNCTPILIDDTSVQKICDSLLQSSPEERGSSDNNDGTNSRLKNKLQDLEENSSIIDVSSDDFESPKLQTFAFQSFFTNKAKMHARPSMQAKIINPCIKKRKRDQKDLSYFWKGVKPAYIEGPDPDVVRIPDDVPPTWANLIRPLTFLGPVPAANMLKVRDIFSLKMHDLESFSPARSISLEGILVDPPWPKESTESIIPLLYTLLEEVCSLIHSGFVFIWVPKHLQYEVFKLFSGLGMRYVENLVWCQIALSNHLLTTPSEIICQSKSIMLIFKKGGEIEIRHQRTADVIFDFIKPEACWAGKNLSCPKPLAVYDMVETLLPNSQINNDQQPWCLLELWAKETDFTPPRPNWIQVHQLLLDN